MSDNCPNNVQLLSTDKPVSGTNRLKMKWSMDWAGYLGCIWWRGARVTLAPHSKWLWLAWKPLRVSHPCSTSNGPPPPPPASAAEFPDGISSSRLLVPFVVVHLLRCNRLGLLNKIHFVNQSTIIYYNYTTYSYVINSAIILLPKNCTILTILDQNLDLK